MLSRATMVNGVRRIGRAALNAVLPPRCLKCGAVVDQPGLLCPSCWASVTFLAPPCCAACGYPFEFAMGEGALCGACSRDRPLYDRARAVLRYDEASRDIILGFKHGDRTDGASALGRWMARAGAELLAEAEVIVPVPLHWLRLFTRRYNQAALLALALSRSSGVPVAVDVLRRRRATPPQGRMSATARRRNVEGAFVVKPERRDRIADRRVLLVDDVLTTGATVNACTRALRRGGAAAVDILTVAQVVRPSQ
ncbi:ComF family protein [Virgifigura deserti]|uniref:ComF family protein n=1 Tax=Virgifigura deserti TaxID=2268457 RepID=UPI003CCBFFAE